MVQHRSGQPPRLPRSAFDAVALDVAPTLLGCLLVHEDDAGRVAVRLTEVEAYAGPLDPGSHAFRGPTPRTQVMFGPPGHLYVYFTYGMHWCANVVCGEDGLASAVLLRAGEVVSGVDIAARRRAGPDGRLPRAVDLARGPARLTRALGLDRAHDGLDVCAPTSQVWFEPPSGGALATVRTGPRVGVAGPGGDGEVFPWRFWVDGEPTVSVFRPGVRRTRRPQRTGTIRQDGPKEPR